ncbi:MAG: hypothetical protein ACRCZG_02035 [Culicoidibacterales bacterium]
MKKPLLPLVLVSVIAFVSMTIGVYGQLKMGFTLMTVLLLIMNPILITFGNLLPVTTLETKWHLKFAWAQQSVENLEKANQVTGWIWLLGGSASLLILALSPIWSFYLCVLTGVAPWFYCQNKIFQAARQQNQHKH